ncbi:MAG: Mechanosensitive channel MscK precursor, partial [Verrucomicrobiota bacterium]
MNRRVSSFIFLCGLLAGCLLLATPLEAQNIKQVIESLAGSAKDAGSASEQQQSAADQLAWVKERMQAAQERLDLAKSDGFQAKVRAAGFPENRPKEIQSDAAEALDSWTSARNLLEWIVVRETVGIADASLPSIPKTTAEAIALERQLEDLENQLSRFEANLKAQPASIARAEEQSRTARHDLAEIRLEADSPLAANARERSDVDIFEATIGDDNAAAQLFFQKWLGYRLELETGAIRTRSQAISTLLRDSGYSRLLTASRASTEISQIEKKLPDLDKQEQQFSEAFDKSAARLAEARSRLDAASANGSAPPEDLQRLAQSTLAEYAHQESLRGALRARSYAARHTSGVWKRVLELVENTNFETLGKARSDLELEQPTTRDLCDRAERFLSEKKAESEKWMQDLRMPDIKPSERASLQDRIKKNETLIEQLSFLRDESASLMALQNRLLEEVDAEIAALATQHRWSVTLQNLWDRIEALWNFQITSSGDREVTLGTILTAIIALFLSLVAARLLARRISRMLESSLKLPSSRSHLVEKLTLYALSVFFVLMVLQWLQIPLTIFAFLGGALAVGIGFGSQNLINNFISGLLLLLEQKINVGDLVEVDGNFGRVTDLGSRCSSIRKFDGVEILVPNSTLLEKNVVNWTLSDLMHRYDFGVGVAYGSDVELVMRTLREAIDAQPEILREPEPEVAFENFGESTLDFHVYYWLEVGTHSTHSARCVGTQLRVQINLLFNQRGIVLAFPQRDINLVAAKPIQVRLE